MCFVNDPIRYGVIGTGMMGVEHIQNLMLLPGAEVVAVADPFPRSQRWARRAAGENVRVFDEFFTRGMFFATGS